MKRALKSIPGVVRLANHLRSLKKRAIYQGQDLFNVLAPITFKKNLDKRLFIPIIILQPGKVGSLSVYNSLIIAFQKLKIFTRIYHSHALNNLDKREDLVRKTRKDPQASIELIQEWKELRQNIESHPGKQWNIINLVRDPVAMKVSALFHLLDQHIPDWQQRHQNGTLPISEIQALFDRKQEFSVKGLDQWYEAELKTLWDIDVFATAFPREKGYAIYTSPKTTLLVIRLEDLNQVAQKALHDFIGLDKFTLSNVNVGEDKAYAALYKQFKALGLPADYVEKAYQTQYARHFYSPEELNAFRKRWIRQI